MGKLDIIAPTPDGLYVFVRDSLPDDDGARKISHDNKRLPVLCVPNLTRIRTTCATLWAFTLASPRLGNSSFSVIEFFKLSSRDLLLVSLYPYFMSTTIDWDVSTLAVPLMDPEKEVALSSQKQTLCWLSTFIERAAAAWHVLMFYLIQRRSL